MKFRLIATLVLGLAMAGLAPAQVVHAKAPAKHTIKAGPGFKHVGHAFKVAGKALAMGPVDSLIAAGAAVEASVDSVGVSLQFFADALDMGVAIPLEAWPKPLNEVGVAVHYVYLGIDKVGQELAK